MKWGWREGETVVTSSEEGRGGGGEKAEISLPRQAGEQVLGLGEY